MDVTGHITERQDGIHHFNWNPALEQSLDSPCQVERLSEIVRARIQPVHKIRADAYTDATNAYNEHYIDKLYLAERYRVSNGSGGELRLAKMEPTFCGFLELISLVSHQFFVMN